MSRLSKSKVWSKRVRSFEASGLSQRLWCERRGISTSSFSYWRQRLAETKPATALVPIVVANENTPAAVDAAIEFEVGGVRLRAGAGIDAAWLCAVVRGLR
jgi:hypothetical protein